VNVYVDILFIINLVVNYFVLFTTNKLLKNKRSEWRLLVGAALGAFYVILLIFFPNLGLYTLLSKVLFSFLIILVSFSPPTFLEFIKALVTFYISAFVFAGAVLYFVHMNDGDNIIRNGIIYISYNMKSTVLLISVCLLAIFLKKIYKIFQLNISKSQFLVPLTVVFDNKITKVCALIDTGNSLYDPLTNSPVVVVEFRAIKKILPPEIQKIFECTGDIDFYYATQIMNDTSWFPRFRLIPFSSLGRDNGILMGFRPDYVQIGEKEQAKSVKDVIVGIYNKALCKNENYEALLNPEIV